ncbi:uncharacterized protein LOC143682789 [Tamandua tetradactyla]|uniref:uncharacterized protein LOC143682789 n=1 Tax=Tamandua tetradactyla TaxID=48850 RepID=UPI0040544154
MPGLRERRAGGGAPAPGPGAPSASLSTSPLLEPALPGHLPPPPRSLSARPAAPTTRRQRRNGGRGAPRRVRLSPAESECLLRLPLLLLRRLLSSSPRRRRRRLVPLRLLLLLLLLLLPPPPPLVPPLPLHQLHPGNSDEATFGKHRQFPPRSSSPALSSRPSSRGSEYRLRQTSAHFGLPLPAGPGSPARTRRAPSVCCSFRSRGRRCQRPCSGLILLRDLLEAVCRGSGMCSQRAALERRAAGRGGSQRRLREAVAARLRPAAGAGNGG